METELIQVSLQETDLRKLRRAAQLLRSGGVVAIPTETVYGLAADAFNAQAVQKIFKAKGRPADNPLIVHIAELSALKVLTAELPTGMLALAERFWPGPLTMIVKKTPAVPDITSGGLDTVAIRFPSHPVARKIIELAGTPLAAPSANLSGSPSPTTAARCIEDMMGRIDAIVDCGDCQYGLESTVISLMGPVPQLLRPGAVTLEMLRETLGDILVDPAVLSKLEEGRTAPSPGMKYKHYAPKARVVLVDAGEEEFVSYINTLPVPQGKKVFAMPYGAEAARICRPCLAYGENEEERAHNLFEYLRRLDDVGADTVYVRCPSRQGIGLAVYNRLLRASGFELVRP